MRIQKKRLMSILVAAIALTLLAVFVAVNLTTGEEKVEQNVERLYGTRAYPPRATEKRVRELVAAARSERPFPRGRRLKPRETALQLELI